MKDGWQQQFMGLVKPFLKSNTGEGTTPPPQADTGTGNPSQGSGISDEFLEKLQSAFETGELAVEEQAVKAFAKANGCTDDECNEIWQTISEGLADEPEQTGEQMHSGGEVQKGGNKEIDPEFVAFAKSVGAAVQSAETHELAIASLVEENQALAKSNSEIKAEIAFIKSEMAKFLGQPVGKKDPVVDVSNAPSHGSKAEIIQEIVKGVSLKKLALGDLQHYKSTGKMTDAVMEFLKSSKGGN